MTVNNCIAYIDSIEPNAYTAAQKAMWISECEGKVYTDLFLLQPNEFTPVTYDADKDRTLALPAPYDRLYPRYLQAMIHYANGEYDRYANSMAAFNEVWGGLHRWFGANYDVSDRRRNRRVEATITGSLEASQMILTVPQGCALAGGRIVVKKGYTRTSTEYVLEEAIEQGTYVNFKTTAGWYSFIPNIDLPVGTEFSTPAGEPEGDIWARIPGQTVPVAFAVIVGHLTGGIELPDTAVMQVTFGDIPAAEVNLEEPGSYPIPMLIADRGGTELKLVTGSATWQDDGEILFTARLLVPDEEFPFN